MERTLKPQFIEVPVNIDYMSLKVPTYENAFSKVPHWTNNKDDPFICTAVFKQSYIEKANKMLLDISRSSENMLPAFFVYESDKMTLSNQLKICKNISNDVDINKYIFSQTFSGSKSIHTLIYIAPEYREKVSNDFKYYWKIVGERIFGNYMSALDSQCASIGRLSRNPNGIRDNGKKQTCIYYNPNSINTYFNLKNVIESHERVLENLRNEMARNERLRNTKFNNDIDEKTKLTKIFEKGKCSESFKLAYHVLMDNECPKGANYVSAAWTLKGYGFSKEFIEELLIKASNAHPTNISKRSIHNIMNKLNT